MLRTKIHFKVGVVMAPSGAGSDSFRASTTVLTGNATATQRRQTLKVIGTPVFDDGVETVLGGIQVLAGSGTWDSKSEIISVKGSGARVVTLGDPNSTLQYEGLKIKIVETAGQAGAVTVTPSNRINATTGNQAVGASTGGYVFQGYMWISTGQWMKI